MFRMADGNRIEGSDATKRARILIADDERSFVKATRELLRREGYVCDAAHDAREALATLDRASYDVMLADLKMPGNRSLELLEESARRFPSMPVVVVTAYPSLETAIGALRLEICDYRTKPLELEELRQCIDRAVRKGRARQRLDALQREARALLDALRRLPLVDEPEAAGNDARLPPATEDLSDREQEIAEAVANGARVATIARSLHISERTVRNHLQSIFRKLGVHSQLELAARFRPDR